MHLPRFYSECHRSKLTELDLWHTMKYDSSFCLPYADALVDVNGIQKLTVTCQ